jgi:hypothetical protein
MKKLNKYILGILILPLLSSCLKDENVLAPGANSSNIIEFYNVTAPMSASNAPYIMYVPKTLEVVPESEFEIAVSYSGAEEAAPQDIVVNLEPAPDAITKFNASQNSAYVQMSSTGYQIPTSVTIKKGEKRAYAKVKVFPEELDQSKSNAIALKISSASTGTISGNFGTVIYSLPIKSMWEGTYTYSVKNNFGGIDANIGSFTEEGVKLSTIGPNRLYLQYLNRTYGGYTEYQFNGDNTSITSILAYSGQNFPTTINEVVLVDSDNLIFEIRWTWGGRGVVERLVRTGD